LEESALGKGLESQLILEVFSLIFLLQGKWGYYGRTWLGKSGMMALEPEDGISSSGNTFR
jgi:hypothetical protein